MKVLFEVIVDLEWFWLDRGEEIEGRNLNQKKYTLFGEKMRGPFHDQEASVVDDVVLID